MPTATAPQTKNLGPFQRDALESLIAARHEPAWLADQRRAAFEFLLTAPWPTLRDEEWRRTDIRAFKLANFRAPDPHAHAAPAALERHQALAAAHLASLATIDSQTTTHSLEKLPAGVTFIDLSTAVQTHPHLVQPYLHGKAVNPLSDPFSALHAAFWTSGALLHVPKGVRLPGSLFHLLAMTPAASSDFSHTLVILEEDAHAELVQEYASIDRAQPGLHCGAVELILAPGSKLRFVNIQNWDEQTWHFSRERAIVGRDASIQWTVGGLGSRLAKVNQEVALAEPGARAQVNGVMFTSAKQNLTYLTRQDHIAPQTTSDLLYKAVLKDQSRVVWKGMIRVEKDAQRTDAYQKNDNLVLSEAARTDSIPGLEIEANDVRCTHGATAAQVDENMIFYLQARGIAREEARRLIVEGFFSGVYDRIALESVRESLRQVVASKLRLEPQSTSHADSPEGTAKHV